MQEKRIICEITKLLLLWTFYFCRLCTIFLLHLS